MIGNNSPFRVMFKFETKFELKILEAELFLNLIQIYWGSKLVWKNLINSQKFLFTMIFQNMNLDWHGYMTRFEDSVPALDDSV
jgi:hypothetical protein